LPTSYCHTLPFRPVPISPQRPCKNYRDYRSEIETIDDILQRSGLDDFMLNEALKIRFEAETQEGKSTHASEGFTKHCRSAFRISILRALKGTASVRGLEITLADSPLEQWFCFLENFDQIKAPSKSSIDRYKNIFGSEAHQRAFDMLLQKAASSPQAYDIELEAVVNLLGFEFPTNLLEVWYDSTCHSPNIHFPTDWVQLGDCCRSLLLAIDCIRRHGVKNRMPRGGVNNFLTRLNQLLIEFGNARRRKDSKSLRKEILRRLKKFAKCVAKHARSHRNLLKGQREQQTDLSPAQAALILDRIDDKLEQLPRAIKQAHERIIGERRVPNKDKILSIHEPLVKVYTRGKSGAEIEYGNQLLIGENRDGLITHYELFEDIKIDSSRLERAIELTEKSISGTLELAVTDRGFSNEKVNDKLTESHPNLTNHCCAKSPSQMKEQLKMSEFKSNQKRRAQTEARIAILTNCYQRGRSLSKGIKSQRQELDWVMLAHNLRKLARMRLKEERQRKLDKEKSRAAA